MSLVSRKDFLRLAAEGALAVAATGAVCPDRVIAAILNRLGYKTGQEKTWNASRVAGLRGYHDIEPFLRQDGWVTQEQAALSAQTKLLSDTIAVLIEASRPIIRPAQTGSRSREPDVFPPGAARINAAMPYLQGMLASMKRHHRQYALELGETALELLPEG